MIGRHEANWAVFWFYGFLVGSLFLIAVTYFRLDLVDSSGIFRALRTFSLAGENNVAAWFSGAMLLVAGMHAYDGSILNKVHRPKVAKGWAAITLIFILLSADEVGSVHERLADLDSRIFLAAYAAMFAALFVYAVVPMWRSGERRSVWTLGLGFLLLGTIPLQEFVEHNVTWGELKAIRTVVEEGTELVGMLILLWACMPNSGRQPTAKETASVLFDFVCCCRRNLLIIGAVMAALLAYVTALFPDQNRGHPADWFAGALFLSAGIAVIRPVFQRVVRLDPLVLAAALLCVFASVASVAIAPDRLVTAPFIGEVAIKTFVLSFTVLALCITWSIHRQHVGWMGTAIIAAIATIAIPLLSQNSLFALYAVPQYLALVIFGAHAGRYCRDSITGSQG